MERKRLAAQSPSQESTRDQEPLGQDERRRRYGLAENLCRDAGERARSWRFSTYECPGLEHADVFGTVKEWAKDFDPSSPAGLVLAGPVGAGKDHLAFAATLDVILRHGVSARWVSVRDMFGRIRDGFSNDTSERRILQEYVAPQVLILSDPFLAGVTLTTWQADFMFRLVDQRWREMRATVVTCNIVSDEDAISRIGAATWNRITDGAMVVWCNLPSYRRPAKEVD